MLLYDDGTELLPRIFSFFGSKLANLHNREEEDKTPVRTCNIQVHLTTIHTTDERCKHSRGGISQGSRATLAETIQRRAVETLSVQLGLPTALHLGLIDRTQALCPQLNRLIKRVHITGRKGPTKTPFVSFDAHETSFLIRQSAALRYNRMLRNKKQHIHFTFCQ